LPEPDLQSVDLQCKEFLSCAFSPVNESQQLVTVSGEGDWCAILWQWEQMKMLAKIDFSVIDPVETRTFQISYQQVMQN